MLKPFQAVAFAGWLSFKPLDPQQAGACSLLRLKLFRLAFFQAPKIASRPEPVAFSASSLFSLAVFQAP